MANEVSGERRSDPPTAESSVTSAAEVGNPMSYRDAQAVTLNPASALHDTSPGLAPDEIAGPPLSATMEERACDDCRSDGYQKRHTLD